MHKGILSQKQLQLLPLLNKFSNQFGLVGGTATALQIGHRRSIDFDLFTTKNYDNAKVRKKIRENHKIQNILVENLDELTLIVEDVKITFYKYPFKIDFLENFEEIISLPNLVSLAAMKAFTLGRRSKWKDYVDLYFIFKRYSLSQVINKSQEIFENEFNEKLFREQLAYFKDIDYSETINYMPDYQTDKKIIQKKLKQISLQK